MVDVEKQISRSHNYWWGGNHPLTSVKILRNPLSYTTGFYWLIPLQDNYFQNDPCESFILSLGGLLYESDWMVVGNFKLNRLGRLVWLWLKLKLTRKGDFCVVSVRAFFVNFFMHSTKRYLNGQI